MRTSWRQEGFPLLAAFAVLLTAPGLARAQTCPPMNDPLCVPTAICTRYGNDPAR